MKIRILFLLLLFGLPLLGRADCVAIDDTGQKIILKEPPQRIISLSPDVTEMIFAMGAGKRIVGVVEGSDYPEAANKITVVASSTTIDADKIQSLHPDLIILGSQNNLDEVKKLNIPFYIMQQRKLTDIPNTMRRLGALLATDKIADQNADRFMQHYQQLEKKYSQKKTISVFYQVWQEPLITVNKNNWADDVIDLCGGKNIFSDLMGKSPAVNLESVINANPEIIIGNKPQKDWQQFWRQWTQIKAVQKNNIYAIRSELLEHGTPRLLEGAEEMCQAIEETRASIEFLEKHSLVDGRSISREMSVEQVFNEARKQP